MSNLDEKVIQFSKKVDRDFSITDFLNGTYLEWDERRKEKAIDSFKRLTRNGILIKMGATKYCHKETNFPANRPYIKD